MKKAEVFRLAKHFEKALQLYAEGDRHLKEAASVSGIAYRFSEKLPGFVEVTLRNGQKISFKIDEWLGKRKPYQLIQNDISDARKDYD